ncbi:phosphoesterase [Halobacteriales archaeon QH_1_68_42]|nr:MAG: phosphoesterase [Halobacteriales archaeon QH_1_68_42]
MAVEPVPGEPAATADLDGERALVVADFHAGIEAGLRREGVELPSRADERRAALVSLVDRERPDRLVLLGDLGDAIGDPGREERAEIEALFSALPADLPVTLAKGNHDGDIADELDAVDQPTEVTPGHGARLGPVGFAHGHTWPSPEVLGAEVVCIAHEHPVVRLEDEEFHDADLDIDGELVVCPAFNDLSGGTWINVEGQEFLAPFLPEGLVDGEAYLLDGTRLGDYRGV